MGSITTNDYLMMLARLQKPSIEQYSTANAESRERILHDKIMEFCKQKRWLVIHSRMDMPCTVKKGTPDFIILASGSKTLLIECKTRTGKLTIEQTAFGIMSELNGHHVHVVRSFNEFLEIATVI